MSKRGKIVISIVTIMFILFSLISFVHSESELKNLQNIQDTAESISKTPEEIKSEYLTTEWSKLLSTNKFLAPIGYVLAWIERIFAGPIIAPVSEIAFGMKAEFSWLFLLVVIIWLSARSLVSALVYYIKPFQRIGIINLIISLAVVIAAGYFGLFVFLADGIISIIKLIGNLLAQTIFIIIIMIAFILLGRLSKGIKKAAEALRPLKNKKEIEKVKEEIDI